MDWKDMSEAERRRWALEQVEFARRYALAVVTGTGDQDADMTRINIFKEAEALIAFVTEGVSPQAPPPLAQAA